MAGWAGFTDEDLRKIRQTSPERGKSMGGNKRLSSQNKKPKIQQREKLIREMPQKSDLQPSQRLSKPKTPEIDKPATERLQTNMNSEMKLNNGSKEDNEKVEVSQEVKNLESRELDDEEAKNVELTNMEKFQKQQKMIEEANKQKKALLAKTLNERRLKAKAESVKLTKIQKELNHLDSLLTADVSVIRDKIELASIEFLDAQKRYDRAEKEVISAKMSLFEKGESKERLTEHLYTIIHQNEVRKAKKLAELMEILEMETSAEEMELQAPSIPTLTNFNSVHTLTSPTRKHSETEVDLKSENQQTDQGSYPNSAQCSGSLPQSTTDPEVISNPEITTKTPEQSSQSDQTESQVQILQADPKTKGDNSTPTVQPSDNNNTKLIQNTTDSPPESEISK